MRAHPEIKETNSPLLPRDRHLFGAGPKRLLALDGGGIRGTISVAFLERIEDILFRQMKADIRLGDYFDFVGGTSTGAIIVGALALDFRTEQVKDFYIRLAPYAFKRDFWRVPIFQSKFDAHGLRGQIEAILGERKLSSPDLVTGLGVVTKRIDTGSPWVITNNPRSPYWNDAEDYIGNQHYRLATLVRASTAAPHFFDPELIAIAEGAPRHAAASGARGCRGVATRERLISTSSATAVLAIRKL
jgi:patatin-like phospholipase/acyl hydrolase